MAEHKRRYTVYLIAATIPAGIIFDVSRYRCPITKVTVMAQTVPHTTEKEQSNYPKAQKQLLKHITSKISGGAKPNLTCQFKH